MRQTPTPLDTRDVLEERTDRWSGGRPRVAILGAPRSALGLADAGAVDALRCGLDVRSVAAPSMWESIRAYREASRAIARDGYEAVHVFDARLALAGALLRGRFGVPVGVTLSERDLQSRRPLAALSRRVISRLDEAFVGEPRLAIQLRATGARLATTVVPPVPALLPAPSPRDQAAVAKAMRDVRPGRLVLAMIWPESRNDLRWFRDAVLPALEGKPVCVVAGAPSRRDARLLLGASGVRQQFRVLPGRLTTGRLAALVRWADVVVGPAGARPR